MVEVLAPRSQWFRPKDGHYPPLDVVVVARWKISFGDWWDFIYHFPSLWLGSRIHFVWYDSKDGVWYDADDKTSMDEPKDWRHLPQTLRAWHLPPHPS